MASRRAWLSRPEVLPLGAAGGNSACTLRRTSSSRATSSADSWPLRNTRSIFLLISWTLPGFGNLIRRDDADGIRINFVVDDDRVNALERVAPHARAPRRSTRS